MKKILIVLTLLLLVFKIALSASNEFCITGKIIGMSTSAQTIVVEPEISLTTRVVSFLKNIFNRQSSVAPTQYVFELTKTTQLLDDKKNLITLDNVSIGDRVTACGIVMEEDEDYNILQARSVAIQKQRGSLIAEWVSTLVDIGQRREFNVTERGGVDVGVGLWPITSMTNCVFEGEPVLINPLLDPKGEKVKPCCDGLILCKSEEGTVTKLGVNYIIAGVCMRNCEDPINANDADKFKIYSPWELLKNQMAKFQESDKISLPKEKNLLTLPPQCLTDDDCFPFPDDFDIDGMRIIKPNSMFQSIGNIPEGWLPVCRKGVCVWEIAYPQPRVDDFEREIYWAGYCSKDDECVFDGNSCVLRSNAYSGLGFFAEMFIDKNKSADCVCRNNACVSLSGMGLGLPGRGLIDCGKEVVEVCGEDNKTYLNPCFAIQAGVNIKHYGKCMSDAGKKPDTGMIPFPDDDPMMCKSNFECAWCNNGCFTREMISQSNMKCDPNKKIPQGMTCLCLRSGMCELRSQGDLGGAVPPATSPERRHVPDNVCLADKDCVFCGQECLTTIVVDQMISMGRSCRVDLQPANAKCVCRQSNCSIEYQQVPQPEPPKSENGQINPRESNILGFCGIETGGYCSNDADCKVGGCSGQVCQSRTEVDMITICDWKDCYQKQGVYCGCVSNKCMWYQSGSQNLPQPPESSFPEIGFPHIDNQINVNYHDQNMFQHNNDLWQSPTYITY